MQIGKSVRNSVRESIGFSIAESITCPLKDTVLRIVNESVKEQVLVSFRLTLRVSVTWLRYALYLEWSLIINNIQNANR